jgi:hypothetical protein
MALKEDSLDLEKYRSSRTAYIFIMWGKGIEISFYILSVITMNNFGLY